jgi:hypothetical protein
MWEADMRAGVRAGVKYNTVEPAGCHVHKPQTAPQEILRQANVEIKSESTNEVSTISN